MLSARLSGVGFEAHVPKELLDPASLCAGHVQKQFALAVAIAYRQVTALDADVPTVVVADLGDGVPVFVALRGRNVQDASVSDHQQGPVDVEHNPASGELFENRCRRAGGGQPEHPFVFFQEVRQVGQFGQQLALALLEPPLVIALVIGERHRGIQPLRNIGSMSDVHVGLVCFFWLRRRNGHAYARQMIVWFSPVSTLAEPD